MKKSLILLWAITLMAILVIPWLLLKIWGFWHFKVSQRIYKILERLNMNMFKKQAAYIDRELRK